jgi:hypothetical protein
MQRRIRFEILHLENRERSDQFGRSFESLGDSHDAIQQVALAIRMLVVVRIAPFEYRVQELRLGLEMVKQTGGADAGLGSDLRQSRVSPPVPGE